MTNRLPVIADIEGLGKIVETVADFYTELQQLKEAGAILISPRDEAYARLRTRGREDIGRSYGTRTSSGFEYARHQLPILRLESRLLAPELAQSFVKANREWKDFNTSSTREYEKSLAQAQADLNKSPKERGVIVLPSINIFTISNKENWEIYEAIFKDQAEPYFELNGSINVRPVNPIDVDSQDGTLLTQMWFRDLDVRSELIGGDRVLDLGNRLRGVLKSGEADALGK